VKQADAQADVVVVAVHAGAEGAGQTHTPQGREFAFGEDRGETRAFAHAVVDAGADLVVGSGPHVVRGIEWYRGRLIAYSLGNLAGTRTLSTQGTLGLSALLRLTLDGEGRFVAGSVVPLRLVGAGTPVFDGARSATARIRSLSREDFRRSAVRMSPRGRFAPPRPGV
jgi:hypothetical protein